MSTTPAELITEWRQLVNTAASEGGSIHDDDEARSLGFKGAFVPGSVVASAAIPLIFRRFGESWMTGGWFRFNFATPVYESEPVQAVARGGAAQLELEVRTSEDTACAMGHAGLGYRLPWRGERESWGNVFPELSRDFAFPEREIVIEPEDVAEMLAAAGDESSWYREDSPWGGPVVPPEWIFPIALQMMRGTRVPLTGIKGPGIWAGHELAIREPLRYGAPYAFNQRVVGKGSGRRTHFVAYEFEVSAAGETLLVGRHSGKFLKATD